MEQDPKQGEQAARAPNGQFPKGVSGNPKGRKRAPQTEFREDGLVNAYTGHGTSRDRRVFTRHQTRPVSDLEGLDLRRGNWLAARVCELLPSECFRKGYTLKLQDKELAEKVMSAAEALGVNQKLVEAGQMERAAGGAALFPVLDGALGKLDEPLDLEDPRILEVKTIHLLEPRELSPETWYDDITSPKFRQPSSYRLYAIGGAGVLKRTDSVIHESRLAIFPGRRVTIEQLGGQRLGWGDNVLTPVNEVINDFGLSWGSAAAILHDFSQGVFKLKDLAELLKEDEGEDIVKRRMRVLDMFRSSMRAAVIDADEDFIRTTTSVAGLADLLIQMAQLVSAAADTPMTRLFGMSPAGMNATGEFDADGWHERVGNEQTNKYTSPTEWLLRLIMLSTDGPTAGDEPDVWSVEWSPLQVQNAKEIAETRKLDAETDHIRIEDGVYSADDVAESRFKGDTYGHDITIDWARRKEQKRLDEERSEELDQAAIEAMGRKPAAADKGEPTAPAHPPDPGDEA